MAQERSQLPTFGNWENGDSVPYSDYFEKARKGKDRAKRNPNVIQSDCESYITSEPGNKTSSIQKDVDLRSQRVAEPEAAMSKHVHHRNGDNADWGRLIGSPLHRGATGGRTASRPYESGITRPKTEAVQFMKSQDARRRSHEHGLTTNQDDHPRRRCSDSTLHQDPRYGRVASESPVRRNSGMTSCSCPHRSVRQNPRSQHIKGSSHCTQHQVSVGGRGSQMFPPMREKRHSSIVGGPVAAPMTPGRSHFKSIARGDKSPNHSSAVPKFGDWDETNPSSADEYTDVFNRVVGEKKSTAGTTSVTTTETPHSNGQCSRADTGSESRGCWCFPWRGK